MPEQNATESAVERANELGVDLASVSGSGEGGRITKADVEKAAAGNGDSSSGAERSDVGAANLGRPNPASFERLAEDLSEKDELQRAHKEKLQAASGQEEAELKVEIVDGSPDSPETPSGAALKKVAGISDDTERGEAYAREKTAVRWGHVPAGDR